ncbi:unnamed protein product [Closterium sp. NIES-53]
MAVGAIGGGGRTRLPSLPSLASPSPLRVPQLLPPRHLCNLVPFLLQLLLLTLPILLASPRSVLNPPHTVHTGLTCAGTTSTSSTSITGTSFPSTSRCCPRSTTSTGSDSRSSSSGGGSSRGSSSLAVLHQLSLHLSKPCLRSPSPVHSHLHRPILHLHHLSRQLQTHSQLHDPSPHLLVIPHEFPRLSHLLLQPRYLLCQPIVLLLQ